MAAPQNFRTALNGFRREDVVNYLEYINNKHQNQVNQLTADAEALRAQLERLKANDQTELVESLQAECASLNRLLEAAEAEKAELAERCAQLEREKETPEAAKEELETYRRAERIEREARERAELVYFQANGVLTEATAKVDGLSADITDMADKVMEQLTQLQMAVSSSKHALQDAASIMNTIRPNQ